MTLRRHVLPPVGRSSTRAYTRFVTDSPTLTSLAKAGGCAAKYPAARLEKLLAGFVPVDSAELLVGLDPADDAAVYRLDDDRALVFTVDFFPPVVDDPRAFGAIAATNALNDVFAMGGVPLLALSITAFPEELPTEMLGEILAGADEVVRAAGAILAGGHTIRDDEPKYGLAVVGTVHPDGIWPKSGARPGDALFLTKPLGTGLVLQAQREGRAPAGALDAAVAAMRTLNRDAADALRPFAPNAVTDVTGFGLLGHAYEMASRSGVSIELDAATLPALPSAFELAEAGVRTGGDRRNRDYSGPHVESSATDAQEALAFDPQTAGGLLVSLPADKAAVLVGHVRRSAGCRCTASGALRPATACCFADLSTEVSVHSKGAHEGASRLEPRGHTAGVSPPRARRDDRDVLRRHLGRVRPSHRVGPRMRPLAPVRNGTVPDGRQPTRDHRVQQPPRGCRRDRLRARDLAGGAEGRGALLAGPQVARSARSSGRLPRSRSAASRSGSISTRLAVMSHFLLALIVLALSVARRRRGVEQRVGARATGRPGTGSGTSSSGRACRSPRRSSPPAPSRRRRGRIRGRRRGSSGSGSRSPTPCTCTCGSRRPSASASSILGFICCSARDAYPGFLRLWRGAARACSSRR